ncbi:MAG: hypothetical protein DHS20C21_01230 [Gemmatimonadota bacterium]|nr:MAG: hypothetical protein DHS20C21_01230 [Gemmatimonadota bacterium]
MRHLIVMLIGALLATAEAAEYPTGATRHITSELGAEIVDALRSQSSVPDGVELFFGQAYNEELPNIVLFVPRGAEPTDVHPVLIHRGEVVSELFDQRRVWVLIVSEESFAGSKTVCDRPECAPKESCGCSDAWKDLATKEKATDCEMRVFHEVLPYYKRPSERTVSGVLSSVTKVLFGAALGSGSSASSTDTTVVSVAALKERAENHDLYYAHTVFRLTTNTINRIVVAGGDGCGEGSVPFRSVHITFGNYDTAWLGASVAAGMRRPAGSEVTRVDPYVLVHANVFRQRRLPGHFAEAGLVFGTRLSKDEFLDEFVAGVRLGGLLVELANLGLIVGASGQRDPGAAAKSDSAGVVTKAAVPAKWSLRTYWGLDYRF